MPKEKGTWGWTTTCGGADRSYRKHKYPRSESTPGGAGEHAMVKHRLCITREEEAQETMRASCVRPYICGATTVVEMTRAVRTAWAGIPQSTIDQIVGSFRPKLEECVRFGGELVRR